jgi:hypothetical protein
VSVQVGEGVKVPAPLLVNPTVPVALVGVVERSLTVAVQLDTTFTTVEPGAHAIEVVVRWEEDGFVAFRLNAPELGKWLEELVLPSPNFQTSW